MSDAVLRFAGDFASALHSDWSVWLEMLYQVSGNADTSAEFVIGQVDAKRPVSSCPV